MNLTNYTSDYFNAIREGLRNMIATGKDGTIMLIDAALKMWADVCYEKRQQEGLFFFCGNGASATMAEHLSHDCFQNAGFLTETVSETSHLTAISNDISYEDVFSYRIDKMLKPKDMLITISSSGNSPNVIRAIKAAKKKGAFVVTVSGKGEDNKSRKSGDLNFWVPLDTYGMVESAHAVLLHCWLDMFLDQYEGGRH